MKLLYVLLVWLACLLPYLASGKQILSTFKPPKLLAWAVFVLLLTLSIWGLSADYGFVTGCLTVLAMLMCMWPALILSAAYLNDRLIVLSSSALLIFSLISLSGGYHGG